MLTIRFHPISDKKEFVESVKIYQEIWEKEGKRIIGVIERLSGLKFKEKAIRASIYDGPSHSQPLMLRYSYPDEVKKAILIHEFCHRLLADNNLKVKANFKRLSLEIHKRIFLLVYPVWVELYGEDFAQRNVEVECARGEVYQEAWDWVLSFEKDKMLERFKDCVSSP